MLKAIVKSMKRFFQKLGEKWTSWVGDHELERAIREHLTQNGFAGAGAKFIEVRLIAIARPGWIQVHRFTVDVEKQSEHFEDREPAMRRFGLVRDDGRKSIEVRVFENVLGRNELFDEWSEGLIVLRSALR